MRFGTWDQLPLHTADVAERTVRAADSVLPVGALVTGWSPRPFPEPMIVDGRYARLEPLSEKHAEALYAANSIDRAGRMWTYLSYGPFATVAEYRAWVREKCASRDPSFYAVIDQRAETPCGIASLMRIDPANGVIELGHLAYAPTMQGTPISTEVAYLLMRHAFELGYRRFEWKCDALNTASRRAALRLGLSYEGLFRQAVVVKGRNRDTAWFALTDAEWPRVRDALERWLDPSNFRVDGQQRTRLSAMTASQLTA